MFVGVTAPLEQGKRVKGTLEFEKAGKIEVEYAVEAIGGTPKGHWGRWAILATPRALVFDLDRRGMSRPRPLASLDDTIEFFAQIQERPRNANSITNPRPEEASLMTFSDN